jgi:hypothetical protein
MALPLLGLGAAALARLAPKAYSAYKKARAAARANATRANKKKLAEATARLERKVKASKAKADIKGFGQKAKLDAERLKQARLKTKQMKKGFGTTNKGNLAKDAVQGTGNLIGKAGSAARTGVSRTTGFFGRKGDPRRLVRKGLTIGYGISDSSDPLVRGVLGDKTGDKVIKTKKKILGMRGGGKIQYKIDNQGQDLVQKMYGGKVKK